MKIRISPILEVETLKKDENLNVAVSENGVLATFRGEDAADEKGIFFCEDDYEVSEGILYSGVIGTESLPLVKYLAEKHKLFVCAEEFFSDALNSFKSMLLFEGEDVGEAVYIDFATREMLAFADEYGWSAEFVEWLKNMRKSNRERLGVEPDYKVGDKVKFDYCSDELIARHYGTVVYVDKLHAIVLVSYPYLQFMANLNRNTLSKSDVEAIVGHPIDDLLKTDYYKFCDMYNPYNYLAYNPFDPTEWVTPLNYESVDY